MPELPEVETVRRGLAPVMEGRRFVSAVANRADLRFALPERFAERLTGARVESLGRRGKYLTAHLNSGETLIMHLGMSGRFTIAGDAPGAFHRANTINPAHDHVVFGLEGGARVTYNDPRRFGFMAMARTGALADCPHLSGLGPEPLSDAFDAKALARAFKGRKSAVKAALLDQRNVAGLGNIYVCEALHRAGVSPRRAAASIGPVRAERLTSAVKTVLAEAIAAGGSSLRDYAHTDGSLGYFQHAFQVYDRAGAPCARPGCPGTVARIVQASRSTFFCPACQR